MGYGPTVFTLAKNTTLSHKLVLYQTIRDASTNVCMSESVPVLGRTAPTSYSNGLDSYEMEDDIAMIVQLLLSDHGTHPDRVQRRIMIKDSYQDSLADVSVPFSVSQSSPTTFRLEIRTHPGLLIHFPRPVSSKRNHLRVARKSCYVEVIAPFMRVTGPISVAVMAFPSSGTKLSDQAATAFEQAQAKNSIPRSSHEPRVTQYSTSKQ